MIDIKTFRLSRYLNLKQVCSLANLRYGTIVQRIHRNRQDENAGQLTFFQSQRLEEGLEKLTILIKNQLNAESQK